MRKHTFTTALAGGAIALIVMFGIDMATSGIERIQGPIDGSGQPLQTEQQALQTRDTYNQQSGQKSLQEQLPEDSPGIASQRMTVADAQHGKTEADIRREYELKLQEELNKRLPGLPNMQRQSTVNEVADGTAGVLQSVSSKGIRMVVSFFEKVTD